MTAVLHNDDEGTCGIARMSSGKGREGARKEEEEEKREKAKEQ